MHTVLKTIAFLGLALPLFSQAQISGIVNDYTAVIAIEPCAGKITVDNAAAFTAGDLVVLIQIKGATINTSNSGSFGNIEEMNGAGLYEKNEILSVIGNDVYLKKELLNAYDPMNFVQLIRYTKYDNAEIVGTLKAKPWDGQSGGILVLEANNIDLEANIDVSGLGYRGAEKMEVNSNCSFLTNADAYHYSISDWKGSPKGEGISVLVSGKEHGRGAQANGGGGGNDHNSGGGGGGNVSAGGSGGNQNVGGFGCDGENPGKGGKACPIESGRIYLGGGGGAGHFDDTGAGSSGANGGGIAIVIAESIHGNGFSILANGLTPPIAEGDGAGGGGAGGTVILASTTLSGDLKVEIKGGDGGSVNNTSNRCDGAGGGGSGGRLLTNLTNLTSINLDGGEPGINTVSSGQCNGPSNGAKKGDTGIQANFSSIPSSQFEIQPLQIIEQPHPIVSCVGQQATINFQVLGNYLSYQWQLNTGSSWENVPANSTYAGNLTSELSILNIVPAMDGYQYRCLVSSPCITPFYSNELSLTLSNLPQAIFTVNFTGSGTYEFQNNSTNATDFHWDFGDGMTSTELNPTHHYADFGDYEVVLTVNGPCGQDEFIYDLTVATSPTASFSFQSTGACAPQTVHFTNLSSTNSNNFQWIFDGGNPNVSTEASPTISYNIPGNFDVILIAENAVGADTFIINQAIEIGGPPTVDFDVTVNNLTVNFVNLSLNASGGFLWSFGDGDTSTLENPEHIYGSQGLFQVTLTAFNDCGEMTTTISVPTGALPLANFTANAIAGCNPMTVQFQNQSFGNNLNGLFWEFPGGEPATSTDLNPLVTYPLPGTYDVNLTATNALGSHTKQKPAFINVYLTPDADFSFLVNGQTASFTNSSTGGNFYFWDFGDGNTSSAVNPVHEYVGTGIFDVSLTTGNQNCGSAIAYQIYLEPSATDETENSLGIVVFPNPTTGKFTVQMKDTSKNIALLRVKDAVGRPLQTIDERTDSAIFDLTDSPAGLYFLEILVEGKWHTKKLLKH